MTSSCMDLGDEQFVAWLYINLLARPVDDQGRRWMLDLLAKGASRLNLVDLLVGSEEFLSIRRPLLFAPPGHFYSPHPGNAEIHAHQNFDWARNEIPGIDLREDAQFALLQELAKHYPAMPFSDSPTRNNRYGFVNHAFGHADAVLLFSIIRHLEPRRIIEVGSGHSSCAILDTLDSMPDTQTRVAFVEPYPELLQRLVRPDDLERHELLPQPLQACPISLFQSLGPGDILFVDSSHVAKLGSDVNYLVFEILPALQRGVWVHIHDIVSPFEYPLQWLHEGRAWNEAYLLRAFLEFNNAYRIELFSTYVLRRHKEWFAEHMPAALRNIGGHLWISRTA